MEIKYQHMYFMEPCERQIAYLFFLINPVS